MAVRWVRSQADEDWLKSKKAKFRWITGIRIAHIDLAESLKNQARVDEPLDEDYVVELALGMEKGDSFPGVILQEKKRGPYKYMILAGNHRVNSAETVGDKTLDAYVVTGDDQLTFDVIARADNRRVGKRVEKEEAIHQATALMHRHGLSAQEAAKQLNIRYDWLSNAMRAMDTRDMLVQLGLKNAKQFNRAQLNPLSSLRNNNEVLKATAGLALDYELSSSRLIEVSAEVKKAPNEREALAVVSRWKETLDSEDRTKRGLRNGKNTRHAKLLRIINTLSNYLAHSGPRGGVLRTLNQAGISAKQDQEALAARWRDIRAILDDMTKGVSQPRAGGK